MQELTVAYRNNDMHTLLRLELEWIAREEGNLERLTDDKLAIYNQTFKEQVADLQREFYELPCHPRYQPIAEFDGPFGVSIRDNGPAEARALGQAHRRLGGEHSRSPVQERRRDSQGDHSVLSRGKARHEKGLPAFSLLIARSRTATRRDTAENELSRTREFVFRLVADWRYIVILPECCSHCIKDHL